MRRTELLAVLALCAVAVARGQSFDTQSNGADGALNLSTPGTVVFDPKAFDPPLNPSADGIYHFTSIHIAKDVTVRFDASLVSGPIFWLSQGPVRIDGILDLNGGEGGTTPATPGSGGFPGGGARQEGYGPGSTYKRNVFLVPLVGGAGGNGGEQCWGGAGGGALLIASSTSITVSGAITAHGGNAQDGAGGGGGSIRLVAPVVDGEGRVSATGGHPQGANGLVRFEAFENRFTGATGETPVAQGKPFGLFLPPSPSPSVRVVSVGGIPLSRPDFQIKRSSPVIVVVEAHYIPVGTVVELDFSGENGELRKVKTTPLAGTYESSIATAAVRFPLGQSRGYVKAAWRR